MMPNTSMHVQLEKSMKNFEDSTIKNAPLISIFWYSNEDIFLMESEYHLEPYILVCQYLDFWVDLKMFMRKKVLQVFMIMYIYKHKIISSKSRSLPL